MWFVRQCRGFFGGKRMMNLMEIEGMKSFNELTICFVGARRD
jgi:hypothetical protein